MSRFEPVDLMPWMNRRGFTANHERRQGRVNAWGNSFPAEEARFGVSRQVGGIPFVLDHSATVDHIECLGQRIELESSRPTSSVALLCCAEMGDRALDVTLVVADAARERLDFHVPGWLVEPTERETPESWIFSHLHYPGDYELALLRPALFCVRRALAKAQMLLGLELESSPFVHVFAATLCHDV